MTGALQGYETENGGTGNNGNEDSESGKEESGNSGSENTGSITNNNHLNSGQPQTGDSTNIMMFVVLILLSGLTVVRMKKINNSLK